MGGEVSAFQTTHWTEILSACRAGGPRRAEALGLVLGRYWRPVYCYLRRRGYGNEEAKDLVQGFFQEAVLERNLLRWASRAKGRFRTLLLTALDRYCSNLRRDQAAQKRWPTGKLVSLDAAGAQQLVADGSSASPEQVFNYVWASQLLDDVLSAVQAQCSIKGKLVHWDVFRQRVLEPILCGAEQPSLTGLCQRYRIPDEAKASNMIVTVKRCFQREMARLIRQVVDSDADVEEEIGDLLEILSKGGARSPLEP